MLFRPAQHRSRSPFLGNKDRRPAHHLGGQQMLHSLNPHPHHAPILLQARRAGTQQPQQRADTPEHRARCAVLSLLGTYLRLCEDVPHQAISSWTTVAMLCSLLWELEFRETARRMVRRKPVFSTHQESVTAAPCLAGPPVVGDVRNACCESCSFFCLVVCLFDLI